MGDKKKALHEFGKAFIPERFMGKPIRANLRNYLLKAGYNEVPYSFFGLLFLATAAITYFIFIPFIYPELQGMSMLAVFLLTFLLWAVIQLTLVTIVIFIVYFFINIKIYKRTKEIEDALPDFLVLVSTNLKGGLSLDKALWAGIRPEFGLLATEMTIVSKRVMTGSDLTEALNEFATKYDAPRVRRNFSLIIGEIESGGKIVTVIDKVIETMRKTKALKSEMTSSTLSYMIFIGVVVILVSPALFALSFQLLQIIMDFTSSLGGSLSGGSGGGIAGMSMSSIDFNVQIDKNHFKRFSMMALGVIGICSSMIISIIEKGDIKGGLKYIPAFTISSIIVYLISMVLLQSVFGGMAP
ncbi:MAG: type II secretion system F family protein [Candidatus Woesearchaeota archaeon]